jgi:hypothetical protein
MRPGRYWIFFRPCRMTWTRWPKLAGSRTPARTGQPRRFVKWNLGSELRAKNLTRAGGRALQPGRGAVMLDDPQALFRAVGTIILGYAASIWLMIHGPIYFLIFLTLSISYTLILGGWWWRKPERLVNGSLKTLGTLIICWSIFAAAVPHQYKFALAFAAYGIWVLVFVAAKRINWGSSRS